MNKTAPNFSFHIDAGPPGSHCVPVSVLIQVIENAQNAVQDMACTSLGTCTPRIQIFAGVCDGRKTCGRV